MTPEELLKERYQLLHRLGEGSGGLVYKARQISTGQTVAVKVLRLDDAPNELNERRLERFRREVSFCSNLSHPDIVRILDSGDLNESLHFAVFEFIPGVTLAELLSEQGALPVRRAHRLMMQVLPPLAHAHGHGISHRDLKPSNLMITADGERDRLKILDFGISIATGRNFPLGGRLTLSHEWVGTPSYASPEQLRGETVGTGSDLYAWALMFVECLTGSSVVSGKSLPEIIRQQLIPEPHELPPALHNHRLGLLLSRVLDKDAARRPGDAAALLSILETISIDDLEDRNGYLRDYVADGARPRARAAAFDTLVSERRRELTELRRATIVCCKLAIIGPSDGIGAEQLDTLLNDTTAHVRDTLGRFGATVSRSFGQYSIAYFGLLRTRDADARLALEAGLEIINQVERGPAWLTEAGLELHAQVGIHNGPVTVQLNDGSRREVEGVTAAIAMRLASLNDDAPAFGRSPVSLVVSGEFHELVSRHARFEAIPSGVSLRDLPGDGVMPVYRFISNASPAATNVPATRFASFVGRRAEIEELLTAWRNRDTGEAVVLLSGDPGIGKSRLALELDQRLRNEGVEWLEVRCLPEWQNGFLRPLAKMCLQDLSLADASATSAASRVAQLVVELGLDAGQAVPLLCAWLSLPMPDGYLPLPWSPQKQRMMLLQTLADLLIARMERGAAVRVEDLHWADPSTLDCLNALLARARGHAVFILMTTRPGLQHTWSAAPHVIELGGLDPSAAHELTKALVPPSMLDAPALARIVERSDGVPLYLEELAMVFCGSTVGTPDDSRTIERARILAPGTVPPSLHDLLASRLDDIGESRQLAQFAATVGREFSLDVLATLLERDPLSILSDVEQLLRAEILVRRRGDDGNRYAFRHALIREAAYDSMAPAARRRTHERVASGLEYNFPALVEAEPDVMAHHWEEAGDAQRAVSYWQRAARKSNMASAHLEGLAQLQRGLALVDQLSPHERPRREAELLLARGATIVTKRGYTDPLASTSFERVAALVPASGETVELAFAARWGLWYFHNTQANLPTARRLADELNQIAAASGDSAMTVSALEAVCETNFCIGNLDECVHASRRCAEMYDFDRHRHLSTVRGDDPHLASLSFEAFAQIVLGQPRLALKRVEEGLALADRLGYPAMKAGMHCQAAWVYLVWGGSGARHPDLEEAHRHARIAIDLANELGFRFWAVYGRILDAAATIAAGDAGALDRLREGSEIWKGAGANLGRCWHLTFMAQALHRSGQLDSALAVLDAALAFCDEHDSRFFEPEIWHCRAQIWLDPENPRRDLDAGLAACAQANERALARGAHWWRLAATTTAVRAGDERSVIDLEQVLARFPVQANEPPLLREARQLLSKPPPRTVRA